MGLRSRKSALPFCLAVIAVIAGFNESALASRIYWVGSDQQLRYIDTRDPATVQTLPVFGWIGSLVVSREPVPRLYWREYTSPFGFIKLRSCTLEGNDLRTLYETRQEFNHYDSLAGIAVDEVNRQVFMSIHPYSENSDYIIHRVNLDNAGQGSIFTQGWAPTEMLVKPDANRCVGVGGTNRLR